MVLLCCWLWIHLLSHVLDLRKDTACDGQDVEVSHPFSTFKLPSSYQWHGGSWQLSVTLPWHCPWLRELLTLTVPFLRAPHISSWVMQGDLICFHQLNTTSKKGPFQIQGSQVSWGWVEMPSSLASPCVLTCSITLPSALGVSTGLPSNLLLCNRLCLFPGNMVWDHYCVRK